MCLSKARAHDQTKTSAFSERPEKIRKNCSSTHIDKIYFRSRTLTRAFIANTSPPILGEQAHAIWRFECHDQRENTILKEMSAGEKGPLVAMVPATQQSNALPRFTGGTVHILSRLWRTMSHPSLAFGTRAVVLGFSLQSVMVE